MKISGSMIDIPGLKKDGRVIIPAFKISGNIYGSDERPLDVYKSAPTLAQFMHAYSSSEAIRASANETGRQARGEIFADFIDYKVKPLGKVVPKGFLYVHLVQRPENITYNKKSGMWIAGGGRRIGVELPPYGFVIPDKDGTLYNPETGLPVLTSKAYEKALKELEKIMPTKEAENNVSDFARYDDAPADVSLSPISREPRLTVAHGPRSLRADWHSPKVRIHDCGHRLIA
ncbi:MAG: hypothetical protein HY514_03880 [Candidatus Aenigmarchaeota archaeon]|nr:hypothetical protein [Candidatus Aenigmarchaeota archaeon]